MTEAEKREAERLTEEAIESSGARDPRDFYRHALRNLKGLNPDAYQRAVKHFQEIMVPAIARRETDPLRAWRGYGRLLAELTAEGQTVAVDSTGRSRAFNPDGPLDDLVLHLPDRKGERAILVGLPPTLSTAQRATYDLLVRGRHRLEDTD